GCPPGPHGQHHWPEGHPACGGRAQSPIDIATGRARPEPALPPLQPQGYEHPETPRFTLANNGHTAVLALPPSLRLQGLPGAFAAAQLHFHWGGPGHAAGAEHLLDGHRAPAEVPGLGGPRGESTGWEMAQEMGLGGPQTPLPAPPNHSHPIPPGQSTSIPSFSVRDLLPPRLDRYYRYNGSLTTPPCFQSVLWTLFPQPVHVSRDQVGPALGGTPPGVQGTLPSAPPSPLQLEQLQGSLYSTEEAEAEPQLLVDNFRAPQELNQRPVLVSFPRGGSPRAPLSPPCGTGEVIAIIFGTVAGCVGLFLAVHFGAKRMR
ncbi:CAH14 anhydrase, partial [Mionectes macconnelli]|nr:CAH14 anhydrase [Mionectes macconnelli]